MKNLSAKPWRHTIKGQTLDMCTQVWHPQINSLSACLNGQLSKLESTKLCQKLFPEEEQVLLEYLKDAACRGFPDTWEWCKRRANEILKTWSMGLECPVSWLWLDHLLDHHGSSIHMVLEQSMELCMRWGSKWKSCRSLVPASWGNRDKIFHFPWLHLLYGQNIKFLDKPTSKTLYIGSTESSHQPIAIHDENWETATLIPIISAAGKVFRPTVIFKGAQFQASADWKNPLNALYVSFHDITAANWDTDIKILVSECHKRVILLVRSARNGSRSILTAKPVNWQMDGLAFWLLMGTCHISLKTSLNMQKPTTLRCPVFPQTPHMHFKVRILHETDVLPLIPIWNSTWCLWVCSVQKRIPEGNWEAS